MTNIDPFQAARIILSRKVPFLSAAIWALIPIRVNEADYIFRADKYWRIYYDPEKVKEIKMRKFTVLLLKCVWHLVSRHYQRIGHRDPTKWKIATSIATYKYISEIYYDLDDILGIKTEDIGLGLTDVSEIFRNANAAAEEIYEMIEDSEDPADSQAMNTIMSELIDSGSCQDGKQRDYELSKEECNNVNTDIGKDKSIRKQIAEEAKKARGTAPGMISEILKFVEEESKVPWTTKLRAGIYGSISVGMTDYSYKRRSRRQGVYGDIIMPGLVKNQPRIAVVLDTSGSMDAETDIKMGINEIKHICRALGGKVTVIACDTQANSVYEVDETTEEYDISGRGGTDMRVGIEEAEKLLPDLIVTITDGYTPWPASCNVRHIAVLTCESGDRPPFGETIVIN